MGDNIIVGFLLILLTRAYGYKIDRSILKQDRLNKKLYKDAIESLLLEKKKDTVTLPIWAINKESGDNTLSPIKRMPYIGKSTEMGEDEYWFNNRIHVFGNTGIFGKFHATVAPVATWLIDNKAYGGVDMRMKVSKQLRKKVTKRNARVLDMCCGVGMSTRALQTAFPDADAVIGIDTSSEMLGMARWLSRSELDVKYASAKLENLIGVGFKKIFYGFTAKYARRNAEKTQFPSNSFDLVTIMYAFHEAPFNGRARILEEAKRVLKPGGTLALVDITTDYVPSESMLAGEPYVLEYQSNIMKQIKDFGSRGFSRVTYEDVAPGHVGLWILK